MLQALAGTDNCPDVPDVLFDDLDEEVRLVILAVSEGRLDQVTGIIPSMGIRKPTSVVG